MNGMETLKFLYDESWFENIEKSSIWLRIYSLIGIPWDGLEDMASVAPKNFQEDGPVKINYATIKDLENNFTLVRVISDQKGHTNFLTKKFKDKLPHSSYVLMTSPYEVDGKKCDLEEILKIKDRIAALLRMHLGNNFLREKVFDGYVSLGNGQMTNFTPKISNPLEIEGPFCSKENFGLSEEVFNKIKGLKDTSKRNRINIALGLFEKGGDDKENNKFFYYWVSMETLCGEDSARKIITKLARHYNNNNNFVQNKLGFDFLKKIRTNLFHNGEKPIIDQNTERYMQLMFLDLLRNEMSLPCQRNMEKMVNEGFDVQTLGKRKMNILNIDLRDK
ncbi:MAG: hypothetical protein IIA63_05755 [Nitrospinae bacterium]|nr:hypothetical protein [Nitrospinota bacterium]